MFGNASISGTAAGIYVVIYQPAQASQGLMRVKSQLSKKDLTISRFKFVAMHMDANRYQNLKSNLEEKLFETSMDGLTVPLLYTALEVKTTSNTL